MEKPQLFISYNRQDGEIAKNLVDELKRAGIEVWKAPESIKPSETWLPAIDKAIHDAYALVVILTPNSLQSQWVVYEWSLASSLDKKIFPVIVEKIIVHDVHDKLRSRQFTDLYDPKSRDENLQSLIHELKQIENEYKPNSLRVPLNAPSVIRNAVIGLDSGNQEERWNSIHNLLILRDPMALDLLFAAATEHPYRDVRIKSTLNYKISELSEQQQKIIVPSLIEALEYGDTREKAYARRYLLEIGLSAIPRLIETWRNGGTFVENVLLDIGSPTFPHIINLLNNNPPLRLQTLWLIEKIVEKTENIPPEIIPPLINMLTDNEANVRSRTAIILGDHKVTDAIPYIKKLLSDNRISGEALTVADLAEVALTRIGTDEAFDIAISHLASQLSDTSWIYFNVGKQMRSEYAMQGLKHILELTGRADVQLILDSHLHR